MSKIYTKTGDKGTSGLFGGQRVPKNDPRLEAFGAIDELNSMLGILVTQLKDEHIIKELQAIQRDLFAIPADLFVADRVVMLEQSIDHMTSQLSELKQFILPGGHPSAATAHLARAMCRRAERAIVTASQPNPAVLQYINRLSDWLFTLARYLNKQHGISEPLWHS